MYRRCGFRYEKKLRAVGAARIAGIDEAGRGALAGPVVAATPQEAASQFLPASAAPEMLRPG